jgi:hypothetical protein
MFFINIKETIKSKLFTFFSNPEIVALTFASNFGAAKASSKSFNYSFKRCPHSLDRFCPCRPPCLGKISQLETVSTCCRCLAMTV